MANLFFLSPSPLEADLQMLPSGRLVQDRVLIVLVVAVCLAHLASTSLDLPDTRESFE